MNVKTALICSSTVIFYRNKVFKSIDITLSHVLIYYFSVCTYDQILNLLRYCKSKHFLTSNSKKVRNMSIKIRIFYRVIQLVI